MSWNMSYYDEAITPNRITKHQQSKGRKVPVWTEKLRFSESEKVKTSVINSLETLVYRRDVSVALPKRLFLSRKIKWPQDQTYLAYIQSQCSGGRVNIAQCSLVLNI